MLVVVDANVLVSELLRRRGRAILVSSELSFCISEAAWSEALHELPKRAEKIVRQDRIEREQAGRLLREAIRLAEERVLTIPRAIHGDFEQEAEYAFMEMAWLMEGYGFRLKRPVGWLLAPGTGGILRMDALFVR